jgi:4-carboxymuconolactone decarboxylase
MRPRPYMLFAAAAAFLAAVLAVTVAAPQPGARLPQNAPRFPQLTLAQLDAQQRPLGEKILKVSSVGLGGPYNAMLRSPVMGDRLFEMLDYLRFHTSVPRRLNEFAILIQGRLWTAQVIWLAHYPAALKAGLEQSVADQLKAGRRPMGMKPDEAAVYDFCTELSTRHRVSDATFRRLRQFLSEQQVVDLTAVTGGYVTIAMLLNATEQPVPPGRTPPLAPLAAPLPVR